ncbi:uroporphyrinogen-III synthase [Streptoalloteichus tenebrarius]|uniref:Uroporphyrinogen-III synthase n=1 Tax=Streptoalloteichus tenebrarius (strain ATCC 17920 / DSM 40477 / JCM 4838 / CBS 697.72 / NBRC 16177 / NCIMB 11028 / NRRL B-12390 / A12253. 1 / ISP 5477) TaxID=1933 RepID=A0ABT1HVS8_STRSD|nr:uroporphyrinogen-III synthase [Streptoalloteichus tenebrarius]MCP2259618.1 uroporphyrinogen-III synthase [Streptoalloteichus tenebrarius]BFF00976.1 uroporphyrinogen-III synthase [Streptoalloteichus tenebrarius]
MTAASHTTGGTATDRTPLSGYTVGVTASRRADELGALLERRGATVLHAPAIRIVPLADDAELLAATQQVLAEPVDAVVVTTGIGFRGWLEAAEGWGMGPALSRRLASTPVLARGPKARGAVRAAGLVESWSPESECSAEVLSHLLARGVAGRRIVVQQHGEPVPALVEPLRAAGATVVEVPVYRWTTPEDSAPLDRLIDAALVGQVDALTFTSAPAAANLLRRAEMTGRGEGLRDALRANVVAACVGSVTAAPLERAGVPTVCPERARIGALARTVVEVLVSRAVRLRVAGRDFELRGHAVVLDGELRPVAPAPMAVLRVLAAHAGHVVPRAELLAALRGNSGRDAVADEHAVETAVGRLRGALGEPRLVRTVVKRGYRLAVEADASCGRPRSASVRARAD